MITRCHNRLAKPRRLGFSLLELSIVLTLVALIAAMGITAGNSALEASKVASTGNRIRTIEAALTAYRLANNRLPCPASGTSMAGTEAGNPGDCAGANFPNPASGATVVEGVVPVSALNLPTEFMFDGWGRKIGYAVTTLFTGTDAFLNYGVVTNCGLITVKAAGGESRSLAAVYVLISYGPNGHGAFNAKGDHVNVGSTNADEQTNCHCDSAGSSTGYAATYIAEDVTTSDYTNLLKSFDDIVRYKERFQMRSFYDDFNPGGNLLCPGQPLGFQEPGAAVGEKAGYSVAVGDINADGIPDLIIGAPNATTTAGANAGKVYVIFGQLNGFQAVPSLAALDGTNGFVISGTAIGDNVGSAVAAGDVNGDGVADLVIGAPNANGGKGSVFVVYGSKGMWAHGGYTLDSIANTGLINGVNGFRLDGAVGGEHVGSSVAVGNINGGSMADMVIGTSGAANDTVYVVYGSATVAPSPYAWTLDGSNTLMSDNTKQGIYYTNQLDNPIVPPLVYPNGKGFKITGVNGTTGTAVAVGDINGDGIAEILIGAPSANTVYVLYGRQSLWTTPFNVSGIDGNNGFMLTGASGAVGSSLAVGDINGDGIGDIIIGAPTFNPGIRLNTGAVYVVFGKTAKWAKTSSLSNVVPGIANGVNAFRLDGVSANDALGSSVAAGDINGDGTVDIVAGAPSLGASTGKSYVVFGGAAVWPSAATLISAYADGTNGFELDGASIGDNSAGAVAAADVNGDGKADVVVGAKGVSGNKGAAYVYFGERKAGNNVWASPYGLGNLPQ